VILDEVIQKGSAFSQNMSIGLTRKKKVTCINWRK
jgi:hypothetical protein